MASSLPGLTPLQSRIVRKAVEWGQRYWQAKTNPAAQLFEQIKPDTKRFSKKFGMHHDQMLKVLNVLESGGLVVKHRRLSAGEGGNGYDGSLHSSVLPTPKAVALVAQYPE